MVQSRLQAFDGRASVVCQFIDDPRDGLGQFPEGVPVTNQASRSSSSAVMTPATAPQCSADALAYVGSPGGLPARTP